MRVTGAVGALYSPHCARVQPGARRRPAESPGRGAALRGHPGDVDLGGGGPHGGRHVRAPYACAARKDSPRACRASAARCCR